jgi:hypothetical protein
MGSDDAYSDSQLTGLNDVGDPRVSRVLGICDLLSGN